MQTILNPVSLARNNLQKVASDPNEPVEIRQLAVQSLALDSGTVRNSSNLTSAGSQTPSGSARGVQATGTPLKLNADVKNDIANLTPSTASKFYNTNTPLPLKLAPLDKQPTPQPQTTSAQTKGNSQSGGCLNRAWNETTTGQVPLPSLGTAGTTVGRDVLTSAMGPLSGSPLLDQTITSVGYAQSAMNVITPLASSDNSTAAANLVESGTVLAEQKIGGPVLGTIAGGVTQIATDLGTAYVSPILGNALYDCFPSAFTPKATH